LVRSVSLAAPVYRPQAGNGRCRDTDSLGRVAQEVARDDREAIERAPGCPHEQHHQRRRQAVLVTELLVQRRNVGLGEGKEVFAVEIAGPRWQAALPNEAVSER
jgi:hypothetical protein